MGAEWRMNLNVEEAKKQMHAAILEGTTEVFGLIKEDAKQWSPRKTGKNAESIDATVEQAPGGGILARLFTRSGYGGWLEVGTRGRQISRRKNFSTLAEAYRLVKDEGRKAITVLRTNQRIRGRFYMYGAFRKFAPKLAEVIGQKVHLRSAKLVKSPGK